MQAKSEIIFEALPCEQQSRTRRGHFHLAMANSALKESII
jgi:hypothetical protein